jgi:hypothetical protein
VNNPEARMCAESVDRQELILDRYRSHPPGRWMHPLVLTARTRYAEVKLPSALWIETVQLASGVRRRIARAGGEGAPLVVVPGLYASLYEGLFVDVAERTRRQGRAVMIIEDRFAYGTLALNGGSLPHISELGRELGALLRSTGNAEAVLLVFSAGAAAALFVDAKPKRIVAWSAAFDPAEVLAWASQHHFARFYFGRVHARVYRRAGLLPPKWEDFVRALGSNDPARVTRAPLLLVHAEDDPIAPAEAVRSLPLFEGQSLCMLPHGAHLGFGPMLGDDVYVLPFD